MFAPQKKKNFSKGKTKKFTINRISEKQGTIQIFKLIAMNYKFENQAFHEAQPNMMGVISLVPLPKSTHCSILVFLSFQMRTKPKQKNNLLPFYVYSNL